MKKPLQEGIYAIDKPMGPTSHDVIDEIRKVSGVRRVGHAGTLDPLASGVLVVAVGRNYTKQLEGVVKQEKEYVAEIRLGLTSTTDDEEGKKQIWELKKVPTQKEVVGIVKSFVGKIKQIPPVYSAIKIGGKKAYKEARRGKQIELKPREVEVKSIEIIEYNWPVLKIEVVTGKGVYIRSLARDIGEKLGVGGYLTALRRTRVGDYHFSKSIKLEDF